MVELLLARDDTDIAVTASSDNCTPLHWGCIRNSVSCMRLYLAHRHCTKDLVTRQDNRGKTAEMMARDRGYQECAGIVRDYLATVSAPSSTTPARPTPPTARPTPPTARTTPPTARTTPAPSSSKLSQNY